MNEGISGSNPMPGMGKREYFCNYYNGCINRILCEYPNCVSWNCESCNSFSPEIACLSNLSYFPTDPRPLLTRAQPGVW